MRTGEIVDLANERRLSAVLDFTEFGGELLILNGGSRAEEFVVVEIVDSPTRTERRSTYCIDSGTSMQLTVPLAAAQSADALTLRIVGGHGEMLLAAPRRRSTGPLRGARTWAMLAAATLVLMLAGGPLDAPSVFASADPEPASADAPIVRPALSLGVPARLPNVVPRSAVAAHRQVAVVENVRAIIVRPPERHIAFAPVATKAPDLPRTPAPQMTDLRVPSTAKSGDFVPVSFGAVARQVKIVASIGPTIVSKTIIGAQHGVITIRSPKSDLDSRVMTVRAYAQNGNRTATLQAMVVLVRP